MFDSTTLKDKVETAYSKVTSKLPSIGGHSGSADITKDTASSGIKGLLSSVFNKGGSKTKKGGDVNEDISPYSTTKDLELSDFTASAKTTPLEIPVYDANGIQTHISVNGDLYAVVQKSKDIDVEKNLKRVQKL